MREDSNGNRTLDSATDKIVVYQGTDIYKFTDTNGSGKLDPGEFTDTNGNGRLDAAELTGTIYTMADINYIWTTNDWLNDTALVTTQQRSPYVNDTQKRRYLFTFIDDGDMVSKADGSEQVDFTTANKAKISPYLHLYSPFAYSSSDPPAGIDSNDWNSYVSTQVDRQINYIRGEDQGQDSSLPNSIIPAMRSRQVDYDCDGTLNTWRMGDVVHSTPTLVGMPTRPFSSNTEIGGMLSMWVGMTACSTPTMLVFSTAPPRALTCRAREAARPNIPWGQNCGPTSLLISSRTCTG
jgi:type IV pilus assembly protein PilY1